MVVHPGARPIPFPAWVQSPGRAPAAVPIANDLFERTAPLYAFLREHLFRDDTDRIVQALWPTREPTPGALVLEIGCGPGVYARRLAAQYPAVRAVGIDRSAALVTRAAARADSAGLANCQFEQGDALALDWPSDSVDAVVASRLFTVVDAGLAIGEIRRVLRPGGRCILAEPVSVLGTVLPFLALRMAGWLAGVQRDPGGWREGVVSGLRPRRLCESDLAAAVRSQGWSDYTVTRANGYLYAVCQKPWGDAS